MKDPNGTHPGREPSPIMGNIAVIFLTAMVVALIVFVISQQSVGFDFSDEGFYLNWITDPSQYRASVTQFGFIYHPLFQLVGNDVAALRYLSRAIELLLAVAVFYILIKQIERPGSRQIGGNVARSRLPLLHLSWRPVSIGCQHRVTIL